MEAIMENPEIASVVVFMFVFVVLPLMTNLFRETGSSRVSQPRSRSQKLRRLLALTGLILGCLGFFVPWRKANLPAAGIINRTGFITAYYSPYRSLLPHKGLSSIQDSFWFEPLTGRNEYTHALAVLLADCILFATIVYWTRSSRWASSVLVVVASLGITCEVFFWRMLPLLQYTSPDSTSQFIANQNLRGTALPGVWIETCSFVIFVLGGISEWRRGHPITESQ